MQWTLSGPASSAQDAAVRQLVLDGVLSDEQAEAVVAALHAATPSPVRRGWWIEVLGYVGGGLMLAGATALVGLSWDELSPTGQVSLLALVALVLAGTGVVIGGGPGGLRRLADPSAAVRRRIVGVLFALASAISALAVGVAVDNRPGVLAPVIGLIVAVAGYAVVRTAVGLLAVGVFAAYAVAAGLSELTSSDVVQAAGLVALGGLGMALTLVGALVPRPLGIGVAAAIALIGAQQPVGNPSNDVWAYLLTTAVALGCLALYRQERSLLLLIAGVLGLTVAVPEMVWDITGGAGGAAAILLVTGAVLLAASGLALRLGGPLAQRKPAHPVARF